MTDPSGSTTFGYSGRGRMVTKISIVNNIAYQLSRNFSPGGRLKGITYPSGRSIDYTRYDSGKIKDVVTAFDSMPTTLVSNMTYNPFGRPSGMNTGFGGTINNQSSECACLEVANPGSFMEQQYIYDGNRNLVSITGTNTPWFNQDFEYDSLGHLKQAIGTYGTINYTYDRAGNRQTRTIDTQTETYKYYLGTNRLQEFSSTQTVAYNYDLNGNITGIGDKTLIYNQNNRLIQVKKNTDIIGEYVYNGLGQRVTKTASGITTVFLYDFDGNIIAEGLPDGTLSSDYLYMFGNRISRVDAETGSFYYYLNNYLGTPILMTNDKGGIVWEASYKPFGEVSIGLNSVVVNNFRFVGQYNDADTGLHYNWHRFYDSKTGRYLRPDPIGLVGGINPFVYAGNDPVNLIDPNGLFRKNPFGDSIGYNRDFGGYGSFDLSSLPSFNTQAIAMPKFGKVDPCQLKPGADTTTGPVTFLTVGATLISTGAQVTKAGAGILVAGGPVGWIGGTVVIITGGTMVVIGGYSVYQGYQGYQQIQ
jgi:RHS repeat-associated protein